MSKIVFKINGTQHEVDGKYGPDYSLNEYLRNVAELRGTKAMCHEGGCGACVVAVRASIPPSNEMKIFSVNSCLVSVLSCHGWEVLTVEGIGNKFIGYHDVQSRLAKFNGTQCGYCTPGWIMNMYRSYLLRNAVNHLDYWPTLKNHGSFEPPGDLYRTIDEQKINKIQHYAVTFNQFNILETKKKNLTLKEVENSFAGNICRCTGYRPIADAFKTFANDVNKELMDKLADIEDLAESVVKSCGLKCKETCSHKNNNNKACNHLVVRTNSTSDEDWCFLENNDKSMIVIDCGTHKWYKPFSLDDVFKAMGKDTDYKLIAGNTGQGVFHVTNYPTNVIDIFNVNELKGYTIDVNLILGAGLALTDMMEIFLKLSAEKEEFSYLKVFYDHMDLVAHIPVRNIGTIGGNLFMKYTNNEFQSDVFLLFETVGAMVTIASSNKSMKTMNFMSFLKSDLKRKMIVNIMLPPISNSTFVKTYKIMPRSQNAHAVVNAGFLFKFKRNSKTLDKVSIVYGSISPKFVHASKTEMILLGKDPYTNTTLQLALKTLSEEIVPEDASPEPSAEYRKILALTLFYKAILSLCPADKMNPRYKSGGDALKRSTSHGTQIFDTEKSVWPLNKPVPKLEALVQCSGEAVFANDLPTQPGEVFAAFVTADAKPGSIIKGFDTSEAFKIPGVTAFYTCKDIPGNNTFAPLNVPLIAVEEEILCSKQVKFYGDPVAIIVANREKVASKAAKLVKVIYLQEGKNKPILTTEDVLKSPEKIKRTTNNRIVKPEDVGRDVKSVIKGQYKLETQHHFYMEPQTTVARRTEDGMEVLVATQWLDLTNVAIAQCLKIPTNSVNVVVRRVGGGFGGKITRSSQVACAAALVTHLTGKTCRFILPLETNMSIIGKRLPTFSNYEVGVNSEGEIQYLKNIFYQENGCSANETISPVTVNHFINCYDTRRWYIEANSVATDTPSNTWCRAPSSTEGLAMIENIMERISHQLNKDPIEVRSINMAKIDNPIPELIEQLKSHADYENRLTEVKKFNDQNRWRKRSLKIIPMTYDVFYIGPYNSLVSIFHADGSVAITHGGIEMGQGINTKTAQVCAYILGIPLEKISVKPSASFTSPNCMVTGASIGSECVAFATMKACETLLERLKPIKKGMDKPTWEELVEKAYQEGVDLQASYMCTTKDIKTYDIYGVCAMEVEVDILTGNHDIRRVDLLEDTGRSLSPQIDVGQIEGAFVMGLGYWTSEKVVYDPETGKLLTDRTWTYKPPGIKDIPADFRIYFRRNSRNPFGVLQSKATGEPAFCLASVISHTLREAVRAARLEAGYEDLWFEIQQPCTVENIFMAAGHKLEHFLLK